MNESEFASLKEGSVIRRVGDRCTLTVTGSDGKGNQIQVKKTTGKPEIEWPIDVLFAPNYKVVAL